MATGRSFTAAAQLSGYEANSTAGLHIRGPESATRSALWPEWWQAMKKNRVTSPVRICGPFAGAAGRAEAAARTSAATDAIVDAFICACLGR